MSQSSETDLEEEDRYLLSPTRETYVRGAHNAGCLISNDPTHPVWRKMLGHVWKEEGIYTCTYCGSKALPVDAHFVFEASELLLIARLQAELND